MLGRCAALWLRKPPTLTPPERKKQKMHTWLRVTALIIGLSGVGLAVAEANRCHSADGFSHCFCKGDCWASADGCGCGAPPA